MRISLPADLLSTAFETRMALHAPSIHRARSSASVSQMMSSNIDNTARPADQRHIVDILVGVIAVPVLIVFALQLEKNIQSMATNPWLVFGLGFGLLTIIMIIIGYVTHRLSVCCWTGPIDEMGNRIDGRNMPHINSQNDILRIVDTLPPSYDTVVKFEIPPPPYDCVIIDTDQCKAQQQAAAVVAGKELPTSATSLHI